jgi:hypothetical protein
MEHWRNYSLGKISPMGCPGVEPGYDLITVTTYPPDSIIKPRLQKNITMVYCNSTTSVIKYIFSNFYKLQVCILFETTIGTQLVPGISPKQLKLIFGLPVSSSKGLKIFIKKSSCSCSISLNHKNNTHIIYLMVLLWYILFFFCSPLFLNHFHSSLMDNQNFLKHVFNKFLI